MAELAAYLQATIPKDLTAENKTKWEELSPWISSEGLEAALLKAPPTAALEAAIVARTADLVAAREKQIVAEVFARTRTLRFTRLLKHVLKPNTGVPVVTTNYDRLIEIAAEEAGLGVDCLFSGQFAGELNEKESRLSLCRDVALKRRVAHFVYKPHVNVFKPHGSLDWYHRDGKPVRYAGDLPISRLIITPGLNKFRSGYESPFDKHRERANSAIDHASRFLVLGYGFNDDHLETHLGPRIRNGVPALLLARTLSPNAMRLARECSNVIAIQYSIVDGRDSSSIYVDKVETQIADLTLWDLNGFISEVLEP